MGGRDQSVRKLFALSGDLVWWQNEGQSHLTSLLLPEDSRLWVAGGLALEGDRPAHCHHLVPGVYGKCWGHCRGTEALITWQPDTVTSLQILASRKFQANKEYSLTDLVSGYWESLLCKQKHSWFTFFNERKIYCDTYTYHESHTVLVDGITVQKGQWQRLMISCCCLMMDEEWMTTYQCWLQWKTQKECCDE